MKSPIVPPIHSIEDSFRFYIVRIGAHKICGTRNRSNGINSNKFSLGNQMKVKFLWHKSELSLFHYQWSVSSISLKKNNLIGLKGRS